MQRTKPNVPRTVFTGRDDDDSAFQAKGSRTPIGHNELYKLKPGDHIGWHRPYVIWHHAIVVTVDEEHSKLEIIHFSKKEDRTLVRKETITFDEQSGGCFRFDYSDETLSQNSRNVVLKRAHDLIGNGGYGVYNNNCETITTYCKTGVKDCQQTRWAALQIKLSAVLSPSRVFVHTAFCRELLKETTYMTTYSRMGQIIGQADFAEMFELACRIMNLEFVVIGAGFEAVICINDLDRLRQNRDRGNMTERDYRVSVTQRVSEAVGGAAISVTGSIIGSAIGGAVAGTVVGSLVGSLIGSGVVGTVGSIVGKAIGSVFGNWFGNKFGKH